MSRGIKNDGESWWEAAGYLARNTACLISCSAFRNSLFTTQACGKGRDSSDSARPRLLNSLSRKMWDERNWMNYAFYAINNIENKQKKNNLGGLPENINYYFNRQSWSNFLHSFYTPPVRLKNEKKTWNKKQGNIWGHTYEKDCKKEKKQLFFNKHRGLKMFSGHISVVLHHSGFWRRARHRARRTTLPC